MPIRQVVFHPLARRDFRSARRWYASRRPSSGLSFQNAVLAAVHQIESYAELGPISQGPFRWVKTRKFPYFLYYEIQSDQLVEVFAVAHARRRPGYWLKRTRPP